MSKDDHDHEFTTDDLSAEQRVELWGLAITNGWTLKEALDNVYDAGPAELERERDEHDRCELVCAQCELERRIAAQANTTPATLLVRSVLRMLGRDQ